MAKGIGVTVAAGALDEVGETVGAGVLVAVGRGVVAADGEGVAAVVTEGELVAAGEIAAAVRVGVVAGVTCGVGKGEALLPVSWSPEGCVDAGVATGEVPEGQRLHVEAQ